MPHLSPPPVGNQGKEKDTQGPAAVIHVHQQHPQYIHICLRCRANIMQYVVTHENDAGMREVKAPKTCTVCSNLKRIKRKEEGGKLYPCIKIPSCKSSHRSSHADFFRELHDFLRRRCRTSAGLHAF